MSSLVIEGVRKKFGQQVVLRHLSVQVPSGAFFFLLGPSGCGKSTLLRIVAGLELPDEGRVFIDGKDITDVPPQERGIGMVFQQYALWPQMTVEENLRFGLRCQALPRPEQDSRVREALHLVRMEGLGHRFPHEISGGQQQRVAVARALALRPRLLLMDEPLSNLDARLRDEIRGELRDLHSKLGLTIVYVTHDQEDALSLASHVALLQGGEIEQTGSPSELYRHPRTSFAATFLGDANVLPVTVSNGREVSLRGAAGRKLPYNGPPHPDGVALLCIRPEFVRISTTTAHSGPAVHISGRVSGRTYRGAFQDIRVEISGAPMIRATCLAGAEDTKVSVGDSIALTWSPQDAWLMSADGLLGIEAR